MALLLHELARHPHVQERLYQEAQHVPADRHPTTADLQEMPFLKAVIKETLRCVGRSPFENPDVFCSVSFYSPFISGHRPRLLAD